MTTCWEPGTFTLPLLFTGLSIAVINLEISALIRFYRKQFYFIAMLHMRLAPLRLFAFAVIFALVQYSLSKSIDKKDCIVGLDWFCLDSTDFTSSPNDDLFAFATLPTDPMDEPLMFSDPSATDLGTDLGTEGLGESYDIFSDYNDLGGFQVAASGRLQCDCPVDIDSNKVRRFVPPSKWWYASLAKYASGLRICRLSRRCK